MKNTLAILLTIITLFSCSSDDSQPNVTKNSEKQVFSFSFKANDNAVLSSDIYTQIDEDAKTITAEVTGEVDILSLVPDIIISNNATITPNNNIAQDFSEPVLYTVEAEDETKAVYTVNIVVISKANQMISLVFKAEDNTGLATDIVASINQDTKKVKATLPAGVDSRSLIPTGKFSEKGTLKYYSCFIGVTTG